MKITVERDVFAEAVSWVARTLPARPISPVLACLRLHAGDGITVSAFDYDVSAQATIAATVAGGGTCLVSGRLLAEIVRSLPAKPVEIATDGARMTLGCGAARFTLTILPGREYPSLPEMPPPAGKIGGDVLAAAAAQVAVAASKDDTLPVLTGVRVEIDGKRLRMAATDRYRLAVRDLQWEPAQPDLAATVLIPARALLETSRSAPPAAEIAVFLTVPESGSDGLVGFDVAGQRTTARLLSGEYPRYLDLLPTEFTSTCNLPAGPLAEAVKRVALVAEKNTPVRLTFSRGHLTLAAGSGEEAEATDDLDAVFDGADDFQIAFNPHYLLDGINATASDTVQLSFTAPDKPTLITDKTAGQPEYRHLLMPIRPSG